MFLTAEAGGSGGPVRFAITTSSGGEQQLNGPALAADTWYHVAITLSGNTGTLYLNGVAVDTNANKTIHPAALGNTDQNHLGDSQHSADPELLGRIDDFRIYGIALPAEQVSQLTAPLVVDPAAPSANPVTTSSTTLSVLATDLTAGESALTYTWSTTGLPPAPVVFSAYGTHAAKNTVATFTDLGQYDFQETIVNPAAGLSTTSTTSVMVAIPGDYNFDGSVDAADYPVWRDNLGSSAASGVLPGDGNGDHDVDEADYTFWKAMTAAPPLSVPSALPTESSAVPSLNVYW